MKLTSLLVLLFILASCSKDYNDLQVGKSETVVGNMMISITNTGTTSTNVGIWCSCGSEGPFGMWTTGIIDSGYLLIDLQ